LAPSDKTTSSALKNNVLLKGVASLEGDNLVVFYYISASEVWPSKER
jgi:hypothetical protein